VKSTRKKSKANVKPEAARVVPPKITATLTSWMVPVSIAVLTITAFLPVLQNGFVNWDDDKNIYDNLNYRGLGWSQLEWMFTTFHLGHYQPLSWVTLGLDYLL
jgi:hypothetical protein